MKPYPVNQLERSRFRHLLDSAKGATDRWIKSQKPFVKSFLTSVGYDYRKPVVTNVLSSVGYDRTQWVRVVMYQECFRYIEELGPENLNVLEISAGYAFKSFRFKSYRETRFPDFDICTTALPGPYDLIIADQVFEHVLWPNRAARNVFAMLRPGGHFLITTPFLIRVHPGGPIPCDCTRWTETGIRYFLAECGFPLGDTKTGSWGNRACVRANFRHWANRGWGSLRNEDAFPVSVWALATRPA
jgi:SAM-dependent methyltransferase